MLTFSKWLKESNEAAPFRIAFALIDQMPVAYSIRSRCFYQIQDAAENTWETTKRDLGL